MDINERKLSLDNVIKRESGVKSCLEAINREDVLPMFGITMAKNIKEILKVFSVRTIGLKKKSFVKERLGV
jgi:hypothetical protein